MYSKMPRASDRINIAASSQARIAELRRKPVEHSLYTANLPLSHYHLFSLKKHLGSEHFAGDNDVQQEVHTHMAYTAARTTRINVDRDFVEK